MRVACITPDRKRDYLVETVLEGLVDLGVELVVSDPGNGVVTEKMEDDDFLAQANACDAILAFFGKVRNNSAPRHHLLDRVQLPRSKKVYVDGSEWSYTGWEHKGQADAARVIDPLFRHGDPWFNEPMLEKCGHYFKREAWPQDIEHVRVKPLPFALCKRHILESRVKDVDVFCSFGHTKTGLRKEAIEVVDHFQRTMDPSLGIKVVVKSGMSQEEYLDTLSRSRIVIDAWGGGDTTDRFWEGVGARACVLYQRHNIVTPNPFVDFQHAVSWSTSSELSNHLHRLVYTADETETIGSQGFEHALRFHTARHRAEEILRALAG